MQGAIQMVCFLPLPLRDCVMFRNKYGDHCDDDDDDEQM